MAKRILALVGVMTALLLAFFAFVEPWYLHWGSTEHERHEALPGDGIIPVAASQQTRAITIHAAAESVWPWLAQLGQDRAGFYSFDMLENLVGCEMPTVDILRPDRQHWSIGDKLWMYPSNKAGGVGFATLRAYTPGRALCFATHVPNGGPVVEDGSWSFILEPIDQSTTRLVVRGRRAPGQSLLGAALDRILFEPMHFVMERRTMLGLKQLAEGSDRGRLVNNIHVVLFLLGFGMWIIAAVLVLRERHWARPLAGFLAAGIVFQVLTLIQPPLALGLVLLAATAALVFRSRTQSRAPSVKRARAGNRAPT